MSMYKCGNCDNWFDNDYDPVETLEGYLDCETGLDMELCPDCFQTVSEKLYEMAYEIGARNDF